MQEIYQPVEWVVAETARERVESRRHHLGSSGRRRGRGALAGGLRRLADAIDG